MTPAAMRATRALQKENGGRLLAGEEFLSQEEIAELIDKEAGITELVAALAEAVDALSPHRNEEELQAIIRLRSVIAKAEAR